MPGTLPLQTLQNTIIQAGRGRKKRRAVLARARISQSGHANGVRWERGRKNGTQERHSVFFGRATHAVSIAGSPAARHARWTLQIVLRVSTFFFLASVVRGCRDRTLHFARISQIGIIQKHGYRNITTRPDEAMFLCFRVFSHRVVRP